MTFVSGAHLRERNRTAARRAPRLARFVAAAYDYRSAGTALTLVTLHLLRGRFPRSARAHKTRPLAAPPDVYCKHRVSRYNGVIVVGSAYARDKMIFAPKVVAPLEVSQLRPR